MKILEKIRKRRIKKLTKAVLRAKGQAYADAFNRKVALTNVPVKFAWNGEAYLVNDGTMPSCTYEFRHERQGHMAYADGMSQRARTIGDAYFLNQIDFKQGDTVLDCGANVGDLHLWFRQQGLEVDYVGFEPSPVEFACLRKNVHPKTVYNVGLWNKQDELTFFVSSQGADSSLIEPASYDEKIVVETRRLDSLIDKKIKLLKLEAEGAEPEILEGAGEKLSKIEFISADLGYERGINSESTLVPVINYLLQRDFEVVDVSHGRICALFRNKGYAQ